MIQQHLNRHLSEQQRRAWMCLLLDTADELKMPDDPEFRSALVSYVGYDILDCANLDAAIEVVRAHPMARMGRIELRPFGQFGS